MKTPPTAHTILKAIIAMPGPVGSSTPAPSVPPAEAVPQTEQQATLTQRTVHEAPVSTSNHYPVGKLLRLPRGSEQGGFRVWQVMAVCLGGTGQEDHYELAPLDLAMGNNPEGKTRKSLVPCWILDTHPGLQAL